MVSEGGAGQRSRERGAKRDAGGGGVRRGRTKSAPLATGRNLAYSQPHNARPNNTAEEQTSPEAVHASETLSFNLKLMTEFRTVRWCCHEAVKSTYMSCLPR